jgi:CubicO group peptidase (beta-lactamase class C family)
MSLAQEIDTIVADAIERRVFPGAVILIARDDVLLHQAAYGTTMYDAPGSRLVRLDTIYDVASLTKMFTTTAALRLSDTGRLDIHAPVAAYLPEFRAHDVTIWHLLTHTSGMDIRLSALRHAGRAGLLEAVYNTSPRRAPGTAVAYTNVNSLLLGEIVARLYGAPLDEALHGLVIEVLGLRDTRFQPPAALLPRIAPTEIDEEWRGALVHGSVHDESTHALGGVAGHAGLFSTAADLYAFCRMWLDQRPTTPSTTRFPSLSRGRAGNDQRPTTDEHSGPACLHSVKVPPCDRVIPRLLLPETIQLARANHTPGLNAACGLGWMLDRPNFMGAAPPGTFGHTGFTGPAILVVPPYQLIVVLLSNRVYPRRGAFEHHPVTAAILRAALAN